MTFTFERPRLVFLILLFLSACYSTSSLWVSTAGAQENLDPLVIAGASTLQPILEHLAPAYQAHTGQALQITAGGSGAGIRQVMEEHAHVGMVSRALTTDEQAALTHVTIGLDSLVFIVNAQNPLPGINREILQELYSGRISHWQSLCDWDQAVVLINKEIGRATLDLFEDYSGLRHPQRGSSSHPRISQQAIDIGSNLESLTLVGGLPGAIGYVSMGSAYAMIDAGMPVRVLPLEDQMPNVQAVSSGIYPIQRQLNLVYKSPTPAITALIQQALSSHGQQLVTEFGFIPVQ